MIVRTLIFIGFALVLFAGCGNGSGTPAETSASPAPPLTYSFVDGDLPDWLQKIRPQSGLGRWHSATLSPDGETLLAQWTAECEIPIAFFVPLDTRKPRAVAPTRYETVAVGWNDDGRAGVFFNGGACGADHARPGLYLVSLDGTREFVTDDVDAVDRWRARRFGR
jgi:hypothetical protein